VIAVETSGAGIFIIAVILIAATMLTAWMILRVSGDGPADRLPRIRSRPLPSVNGQTPVQRSTDGRLPPLIVAGRTYQVVDGPDPSPETCPWCLGSLDGVPAEEIVHCQQPYCGRAAHRRHNQEFGGCGGVCSVTHA
jgi:hypothetical protein